MVTKAAYQKKLQAQLAEWDARIDLWSAQADKASANARIEYEKELDSLRRKRKEAMKTFEEIGDRGDNAWEDMKTGAERIWEDMRTAMDRMADRFK